MRYRLLETIRHYAREKLYESGEDKEAAMVMQELGYYYIALNDMEKGLDYVKSSVR